MKPKWYFAAGSILTFTGIVGLSMGAIFFTNLTLYLLRRNANSGHWRLELILQSFPLWIPLLAFTAVFAGIWFLRRYDFSYKKNFALIITAFILSVIISAWLMDRLGINDAWSRQGRMRRFYQQLENQDERPFIHQGKMKNEGVRFFYD